MPPTTFKLALLGEGGKSSLLIREFRSEFYEDYDPTIEDSYTEDIQLNKTTKVTLCIQDTGNEFYNIHNKKWIEWADGFMLVYSIDSRSSFESASKKREDIMKIRNFKYSPMVVVATKSDLSDSKRIVSYEEGLNLSNYYRCPFIETSSKTGHNVHEAFLTILNEMNRFQLTLGKNIIKSGYLKKRGHIRKNWKKRYFILTSDSIKYYAKPPDPLKELEEMKGLIALGGSELISSPTHPFLQEVRKELGKKSLLFAIKTISGLDYFIEASNETEHLDWTSHISMIIDTANIRRASVMPNTSTNTSIDTTTTTTTITTASSTSTNNNGQNINSQLVDLPSVLNSSPEEVVNNEETLNNSDNDITSEPEPNSINNNNSGESTEASDINKETTITAMEDILLISADKRKKICINTFNKKPKEGINMLSLYNVIEKDSKLISKFLLEESELRKSKIGEYLGENDPFALEVLREFTTLFDFTNKTFDESLRHYLNSFRLPGEAQKIDRIMECWSQQFCLNNPNTFESPDTAYILAFSTIMLNTDAHNPNVVKKMSKQQFISNNRGINNGKDLDVLFLENIYDTIISNQIEMQYDREDISSVDLQGWLSLMSKSALGIKSWQRKFCIITGRCLYIFEQPTDTSPIVIVPLVNLAVEGAFSKTGKKESFLIYNPQGKIKTAQQNKERYYEDFVFCADSWKKKFEWILSLSINSSVTPNYK